MRQMLFEHLMQEVEEKGTLTRAELTEFRVKGEVYKLVDRNKGIWNPRNMLATLSIMSKPDSQYADEEVGESLYAYAYREGNVNGDNTKLRRAYELGLPIILLRWIRDGVYVPVCPVYVVADDMDSQRFILALDESLRSVADPLDLKPIERAYAQRVTRQRLHQPEFRGRILLAYDRRCAVCAVGHAQLLDAAHIIGDAKEHGSADVVNGLCLCKIHHAAYDANLLGVAPDYRIHVGAKLMRDRKDGPMLRHGFQEMDGKPLTRPQRRGDWPSPDLLEERFSEFRAAG
ncbi:HNH endonuclease [Nocardia vinacea]|uniref:HNH endonuclease n=1 Tax=Nocardia vinacea TaxID=96468 RepID=A0ABZ1YYU4_9NOCA|nr:HNH endonuclease [Nocardia vinacea]